MAGLPAARMLRAALTSRHSADGTELIAGKGTVGGQVLLIHDLAQADSIVLVDRTRQGSPQIRIGGFADPRLQGFSNRHPAPLQRINLLRVRPRMQGKHHRAHGDTLPADFKLHLEIPFIAQLLIR
ncbi:hypothetical protein ACFOLJ_04150 [Rugamonas sp. CCM 8940]|uniref:hypothetical protein n=1 Tax=Rugamonas sp. CCM 8940 TaxID=2765359 RepID=UPI0018F3A63C|nr:hypothetical protein [Rugamonas sp. CCM 8940]MBJ7312107.1 hypothetical protein [Rugamonas sp. CCM 8940]